MQVALSGSVVYSSVSMQSLHVYYEQFKYFVSDQWPSLNANHTRIPKSLYLDIAAAAQSILSIQWLQ